MNFDQLPTTAPQTPFLDRINAVHGEISALSSDELVTLADELREFLLYSVSTTGGHFGAGLGVVELTVALHHVFNTPDDRIVWDVGHQCYPHKVLTGRRDRMGSMRQKGGLSGFPKRSESDYDTFGVGHSSTSISAAMGMALAARQQGIDRKVVAVIGDGAITGGMAFEAGTCWARTPQYVGNPQRQPDVYRSQHGWPRQLFRQNLGNSNLPDAERNLEEAIGARQTCLGFSKAYRRAYERYGRSRHIV